jgi:hypothetical protein
MVGGSLKLPAPPLPPFTYCGGWETGADAGGGTVAASFFCDSGS